MEKTEKNIKQNNKKNKIDAKDKIDYSKYTLDSINEWIKFADQKISIIFGAFSVIFAIFGIVLERNLSYVKDEHHAIYLICIIIVIISIILFILGLIFFLIALNPSFNSSYIKGNYSIFFGNISTFEKEEDFLKVCNDINEESIITELNKEIYHNSVICSKKMKRFKKGLIISSISIILNILIVLFLVIFSII